MRIDCHVHTSRYSGCSTLEPNLACRKAMERGLDGIVFTEHFIQWPRIELNKLRGDYPKLAIYSGVEITVHGGIDVVLITDEMDLAFPELMTTSALISRLHEFGAPSFLFVAHPFRWVSSISDDLEDVLTQVDGIEMNSINILRDNAKLEDGWVVPQNKELYLSTQHTFGLTPLFNSDAHSEKLLGSFGNILDIPSLPSSGSALADLLKRTTPREYQNPLTLKQFFGW